MKQWDRTSLAVNSPFFDRAANVECIADSRPLPIYALWLLFVGLFGVGWINYGPELLTSEFWLQPHGLRYTPLIGIPLFAIAIGWLLYWSLDAALGFPCYLGRSDEYLVINRRKHVRFSALDFSKSRRSDRSPFLVEVPYRDGSRPPLEISSLMSDLSAAALIEELRAHANRSEAEIQIAR